VADAILSDAAAIAGHPTRVWLFSTTLKARERNIGNAASALAALAGGLRLSGVKCPIVLDLASESLEIPNRLDIELTPLQKLWISNAAEHSGNAMPPLIYSLEHSSGSMFGDLDDRAFAPLRITIGGKTEAIFWQIRLAVRAAALAEGYAVAPAVGLFLKALRRPWYYPTAKEPPLAALKYSASETIAQLDRASDPTQLGGNHGLRREARAFRRIANNPSIPSLVDAVSAPVAAARFISNAGFVIAPRLDVALRSFV
jgi:hypothetical protein